MRGNYVTCIVHLQNKNISSIEWLGCLCWNATIRLCGPAGQSFHKRNIKFPYDLVMIANGQVLFRKASTFTESIICSLIHGFVVSSLKYQRRKPSPISNFNRNLQSCWYSHHLVAGRFQFVLSFDQWSTDKWHSNKAKITDPLARHTFRTTSSANGIFGGKLSHPR